MFLSYLKCFNYEFLNVQFKIFVRNKVTVMTTWMRTVKEVNFIHGVLDAFSKNFMLVNYKVYII